MWPCLPCDLFASRWQPSTSRGQWTVEHVRVHWHVLTALPYCRADCPTALNEILTNTHSGGRE